MQPLLQVRRVILVKLSSHKPIELSAADKTLVGADLPPSGTDHTKIKERTFPDLNFV